MTSSSNDSKWVGIAFVGATVCSFMTLFMTFSLHNELKELKSDLKHEITAVQELNSPSSCTFRREKTWYGFDKSETVECSSD